MSRLRTPLEPLAARPGGAGFRSAVGSLRHEAGRPPCASIPGSSAFIRHAMKLFRLRNTVASTDLLLATFCRPGFGPFGRLCRSGRWAFGFLVPRMPTDMLLSVSVLGFRVVDPICAALFRSLLFSLVCVRFGLVELVRPGCPGRPGATRLVSGSREARQGLRLGCRVCLPGRDRPRRPTGRFPAVASILIGAAVSPCAASRGSKGDLSES